MAEEIKKPRGRPFQPGVSGNPGGRKKAEPLPDVSDALPDEQAALRALWNRAQSGKQGSTAAYKTYLEYLVGKAAQRERVSDATPKLSEETARRMAAIAGRLLGRAVRIQIEYAQELLAFIDSFSEVDKHKLSAMAVHSLRMGVQDKLEELAKAPQKAKSDEGHTFKPEPLEEKREAVPPPAKDYGKAEEMAKPLSYKPPAETAAEVERRVREAGVQLPKL